MASGFVLQNVVSKFSVRENAEEGVEPVRKVVVCEPLRTAVGGYGGVFVDVPATHSNWVVSFLLHWTFGVELAVTAIAAWVVFSQVREGRRVAASRH